MTHVFRFPAPKKKNKGHKADKQAEAAAAAEGAAAAAGADQPQQEPTVKARELPMTKGIFADKAEEDKTGLAVWSASVVFSHWLSDNRAKMQGKAVLELGSGCGLPGLTVLVSLIACVSHPWRIRDNTLVATFCVLGTNLCTAFPGKQVTGGANKVVLTDFFQHTVDNLSYNLELNCTPQA